MAFFLLVYIRELGEGSKIEGVIRGNILLKEVTFEPRCEEGEGVQQIRLVGRKWDG